MLKGTRFASRAPVGDGLIQWLAHGLTGATGWQILIAALVMTHITIASVTIYLHRHQAHRSLDLHPIPSHFFRFWLWLTTGQVTKEWTAIHRKHHAKCEQAEDPHSPHVHGIKTVLLQGAELYRKESKNLETLARYGHGTPDDWVERNVYTRFSWQGVGLMLVIDLALFGAAGLSVWALQMAWIPITAAGIINGAAHYWGYRNFEAQDASANISPWGILIGGEELHNNHHTYIIANRYEVMAGYAREMRAACQREIEGLKARSADLGPMKVARDWLHRDDEKVPADVRPQLALARAEHPVLDKMVTMREELRALWSSTHASRDQLANDLQAWCRRAEESGIAALRDFSVKLRSAHA